jgi:hypothetical protein
MVGRGKLYDEESRSQAPEDIADIHFDDADSVSPIEIACCQPCPGVTVRAECEG